MMPVMMPMGTRALLASTRSLLRRPYSSTRPPQHGDGAASTADHSLTGSAKLFADALNEEADEHSKVPVRDMSRDHLVAEQGPVWTGDESTHDAVLRMLIDSHKPLRTGEGIKPDAADERIRRWMKNLDMAPRAPVVKSKDDPIILHSKISEDNPHRTKIPPHLHRPWHSTYTGDKDMATPAQIKYGNFEQSKTENWDNLLELKLPPNADEKQRAKVREARKSHKLQGRLGNARESSIDYRLGIKDGDATSVGSEGDEDYSTYRGNRQRRGSSVLGASKGGASGMRAWDGLIEERIQRAKGGIWIMLSGLISDAGLFKVNNLRGAPLARDENENNPFMTTGDFFMCVAAFAACSANPRNRIVKRQGALPPWIELQNQVESDLRNFRSLLKDSYVRQVSRNIIATHSMETLPPKDYIPGRDEAWEAREHGFHEENVRQLNNLIRKMNTLAPMPSRKGMVVLEQELDKIRGDVLRDAVWNNIQMRKEAAKNAPAVKNSPFLRALDSPTAGSQGRLGKILAALGSGGMGAGNGGNFNGSGGTLSAPDGNHQAGGGLGLIVFAAIVVAALLYFKKPMRNEELHEMELIPVREEETERFPISSPNEEFVGVLGLIRQWILEPFFTFLRFIHLALIFGPVILTSPMLMVGSTPRRKPGTPVSDTEDNWGALWWYGFLVRQMERAGPSFIKLGQWAASRTDLFPAALCEKMSKLHSNNNPHKFRHTKRVIEKAFGMPMSEIFEEFDEKPIGCGAIAQVYRAKLRPEMLTHSPAETEELVDMMKDQEGDRRIVTSVAIKVLHPRVAKTVRRDITIMKVFANLINLFPGMEWISLPEEVDAFSGMMTQQLDLRVEGNNLDTFRRNFAKRGNLVVFPRAFHLDRGGGDPKMQKEVLVEEYEDALPLKYFLTNGGGPYDAEMANIGLDAFLEMLLLDNFTHGDLHPGNILVRFVKPVQGHIIGPFLKRLQGRPGTPEPALPTESKSDIALVHELKGLAHDKDAWLQRLNELDAEGYIPQLIFIDAGLVTSLSEKNRRDFLDLFQAIAEFDGYRAGRLMVERCRRPDLAVDEETFALKIQHLVLNVKSKTFSLAKIRISDVLSAVLTAVRQHHVKLEGDFVNTIISILLLEGIGRQLNPDMDLFQSALPILRQLGKQMGTSGDIAKVPTGNLLAMLKVWVWAEVRGTLGQTGELDKWIRYDWFSPDI